MRCNQKKALKLLKQANRLSDHGRDGKATKRYEQALALDPTNPNILKLFSIHLIDVENYVRTIELCDTMIEIKPSFFAYYFSANAYYILHNHENALERLNSAMKLQPNAEDSERVYDLRFKVLYLLERYESALTDFNRMRNPDQICRDGYVICRDGYVRSLIALQKFDKALEESLDLIEELKDAEDEGGSLIHNQQIPHVSRCYFEKGLILNDAGQHHEALLTYNKAIEIWFSIDLQLPCQNEMLCEIYLKRGILLYSKFERFNEAFDDFEKALELGIDNDDIHYHYAQACMGMDKIECGLKHIDIYIQSAPQNVDGYWLRSAILLRMGKIDETRAEYVRAWSLAPTPKRQCLQCGLKCEYQKLLKTCSDCRGPSYCSRECQKMNWVVHKKDCKNWNQFIMETKNYFPEG